MDPQACLYEMLEHMESGNRVEVVYALEDLADWIKNGGFLPQVKKDHNPRSWWIPM